MIDSIISSVIQCGIVVIITIIIYLLFCREKHGYFNWIGIYLPKSSSWIKRAIIIFIASLFVMIVPIIIFLSTGDLSSEMLVTEFTAKGLSGGILIAILFKAIIKTALAEELFFRGLLGKRIANKFGYLIGNITQAVLFGLPHGLPFILVYKKFLLGIVLIIAATIVGFMEFYINEKKANGSILPSICIHGFINIVSFISQAIP